MLKTTTSNTPMVQSVLNSRNFPLQTPSAFFFSGSFLQNVETLGFSLLFHSCNDFLLAFCILLCFFVDAAFNDAPSSTEIRSALHSTALNVVPIVDLEF